MELLNVFPRRLFWRRWQTKLSKLSQHFFFNLVWELSDTPLFFVCVCRKRHLCVSALTVLLIICSAIHLSWIMEYFSYRIVVLLGIYQQQNVCLQLSLWKDFHLQAPWVENQPLAASIETLLQVSLKLHVTQLGFHQCLGSQMDFHQIIIPQIEFYRPSITYLHVLQFVMPHPEFLQVHPHAEFRFRVRLVGIEWLCRTHRQCMHTKEFQNWLNQRRKLMYLEWSPALRR
jgi:hypothetical protein